MTDAPRQDSTKGGDRRRSSRAGLIIGIVVVAAVIGAWFLAGKPQKRHPGFVPETVQPKEMPSVVTPQPTSQPANSNPGNSQFFGTPATIGE